LIPPTTSLLLFGGVLVVGCSISARDWLLASLVLFLMVLHPRLANAGSDVGKGPAESWVTEVDIPTADPTRADQIRNGISSLLSDWQVMYRPGGYVEYEREVYKVVDRPGLEQAATINLNFDPARHSIKLNHLRVIRDGVVQDRLAEATFDIYRQERDSVRGVFDGWLTARLDVRDVRVGDTIDYATTSDRKQLVGEDLFYYRFATEWEMPIGMMRREIIWPTSRPLTLKEERTTVKPKISNVAGHTRYLWEIVNPEPVKVEDNLPASFAPWGYVQISSTTSWRDVADAVAASYQPVNTFPPAFAAKLDEIAAHQSDPRERMVEALRIVQDEVRYISLSMGAGSYLPRDPATVIASGFGDCKDKALLLASALTYLGVKAEVALADLDGGYGLASFLPALRAFDHAIVRAEIGSRVFWLDGTDYLQGGRGGRLVEPDYGYVLPLSSSRGELEKMQAAEAHEPTTAVAEEISFPVQAGDPLTLRTVSTYRGADADAMRRKLAGQSLQEFADSYLKYYDQQYPGIRSVAALKPVDDRDRNVITLSEAYELSPEALAANDLAKKFPLRADLDDGSFPKPAMIGRVGPIWIGNPMFRRHSVVVKNLKARFAGPEAPNVMTPYMTMRIEWSNTPTEFTLNWDLKKLASEVPASAVGDYVAAVGKITDNTRWFYDFTHEEPDEEEGMSGLQAITFVAWLLAVLATCVVEQRTFKPRPGQLYWPISPQKFVVMTVMTGGLYGMLWGWRVFRQQNLAYGARYWSFLRGVFLSFFAVQIFLRVNRDLGARQVATGLGVVAGLLLLGSEVYTFAIEPPEAFWANGLRIFGGLAISALAPLPLVVAINRINERNPEYLARNALLSGWDKVWMVFGVFFTVALTHYDLTSG
jgi:transglutaminase-like putative cysteine protease